MDPVLQFQPQPVAFSPVRNIELVVVLEDPDFVCGRSDEGVRKLVDPKISPKLAMKQVQVGFGDLGFVVGIGDPEFHPVDQLNGLMNFNKHIFFLRQTAQVILTLPIVHDEGVGVCEVIHGHLAWRVQTESVDDHRGLVHSVDDFGKGVEDLEVVDGLFFAFCVLNCCEGGEGGFGAGTQLFVFFFSDGHGLV